MARNLFHLGTRHLFGISGSGPSLELITAMETLGARYFPVSHEAAGAIMAGAVTRVTNRPAASLSIKGPGLANMSAGIIANALENYPAISIAESYSADVPSWRQHKRIDQAAILAPVVKNLLYLNQAPDHLGAALDDARREPRGPLHLELGAGSGGTPTLQGAAGNPDLDSLQNLWQQLERCRKPLVIAGSLAGRRDWGRTLGDLSIPVMTTVSAKGLVDEAAPHSAGIFSGAGKNLAPERALLEAADLVLCLGVRNHELLGFPFPENTWLLGETHDGLGGFPNGDNTLLGTPDHFSKSVALMGNQRWGEHPVAESRNRLRRSLLDGSWLPATLFECLNQLDSQIDLTCDVGSFCTIGEHLFLASPERGFYCSGNGRNMGTGIPTAMGVAVANGGKPVVCVSGDGGFGMYVAEIKLAVAESLPICFVLASDGRYGSIACAPQSHPMSERAVTMAAPSWLEAVAGMGCPAFAAANTEAFARLLGDWERRGPIFIETTFAAEPYAAMTTDLR